MLLSSEMKGSMHMYSPAEVLSPFGVRGGVQLTLKACGDKGVTSGAGTFSGLLSSV